MNETREFDLSERLIEIADEFAQCVRNRESPSVDDFAERYPDEAVEIRRYLPLLLAMEKQTVNADGYDESSQSNLTLPIPVDQLPLGISRYHVKRLVGQGAMGAVYEAHDLELDRSVALKMPQLSRTKRHAVERFYREARAMATVDHPNICSIYDVGEFQPEDVDAELLQDIVGSPYLTMAFIEGTVLSESMSERRWTSAEAAELTRKLASALEGAHASGVVHRDIKPGNIVIDGQGEPILMDFGLARRDLPEEIEITVDGQIIGSPAYMSPEQINCRRKVGPPTDTYSLGIVLYELVCGKRPFTGSKLTLLRDVCWAQPPSPSEIRGDVDAGIESICLKAIAKDPADRYATAGDFANDLQAYLDGVPASKLIAGSSQVRRRQKFAVNWPVMAGIIACVTVAMVLTWPLWGRRVGVGLSRPANPSANVVIHARALANVPFEQVREPLHALFYDHFRFRRHKTREPDMSASYREFFARFGITPEETSAKDLQVILNDQVPEMRTEILIGLESWLLCITRETEDVPVPWLRSLLEFNHTDHTPLRSAILKLDSARLSVLLRQFAIDHYDPRIPVIWSFYLRKPDRENAKQLLARAYESYPDNLWVNAAFGLRRKDNTNNAGAVANFRTALAIEESTELLTYLGMGLLNQKKRDEAIEAVQRAIELDPEYGSPQFTLGKALFLAGENEDAASTLSTAIQNECHLMALAHRFRAQSLIRLGQIAEGMKSALVALSLFREREQWRNIMRLSKGMLDDLEQADDVATHQRFRFVMEYYNAAIRFGQGGAVRPYAIRVRRDLNKMEPKENWRMKQIQRVIATIDKHRNRKR